MNRRFAISSAVTGLTGGASLLTSLLAWNQELPAARQREAQGAALARQLRFTLTLSNPHGKSLRDQTLWIYMPVKRSSTQDLKVVETSVPNEVVADALGHSILKLSFPELAPLTQRVVTVAARLELLARPRPMALISPEDWLKDEMFTEVNNVAVVALAKQLKTAESAQTARNIYDWVSSNIAYPGYIADDLGALYALKERKGDCTEFAFLVVALARACQIPARMVGGYVTDRDAAPRADEYHNWAELYWSGSWNIIDALKKNWLGPTTQYVAFRYFRATTLSPIGLAHRFKVQGDFNMRM